MLCYFTFFILNFAFDRAKRGNMYPLIFFAGFCGGAIRGLVGFIKHQYSYKNVGFNLPYFFGMLFLSGTIGILCAASVNELGIGFLDISYFSPALAFIIGYAGGDFIENIYKIIIKKSSLYQNNK